MSRSASIAALAVALASPPCPAQFIVGPSEESRPYLVMVESADGRSLTGTLRVSSVDLLGDLGLFRIKPEKVEEIRFSTPEGDPSGVPAGPATPTGPMFGGMGGMGGMGGNAMLRIYPATVTTTSGEEIGGQLFVPQEQSGTIFASAWTLQSDLGTLALEPSGLKAITFMGESGPSTDEDEQSASEAEPSGLAESLAGAWALAGEPGSAGDPPATGGRIKFFTDRHWCITQSDPETGLVTFHHGGTYTLDGDTYTETIVYANDSTANLIGKSFTFTVKVEGDTYTQTAEDNPYSEVWKRAK